MLVASMKTRTDACLRSGKRRMTKTGRVQWLAEHVVGAFSSFGLTKDSKSPAI
jgi:hypothetical protein